MMIDSAGAAVKGRYAFVVLLLAMIVGSVSPQPARPALIPGGPAPDLNLVFTSQVVGWIEPCG